MNKTTSNKPTVRDVAAEALRLAEADPEFVYVPPIQNSTVCQYVHAGVGSCLFGQALINVGIRTSWVSTMEGKPVSRLISAAVQEGLLSVEGDEEWAHRASLMRMAQRHQDQREIWGSTVRSLRQAAL